MLRDFLFPLRESCFSIGSDAQNLGRALSASLPQCVVSGQRREWLSRGENRFIALRTNDNSVSRGGSDATAAEIVPASGCVVGISFGIL